MKSKFLRRRSTSWAMAFLAVCLPPTATAHAAVSAMQTGSEAVPQDPLGKAPPGVPDVIHWCAKHCITLILQNGRYTNAKAPGASEWILDSFTRESFVMRRTDYQVKAGETVVGGKAVLSGRISEQGNTVADGKITWTYHPCCGTGTGTFTASWGAALDTVPGSDEERDHRLQVSPLVRAEICKSFRARLAMQSLEIKMLSDPSVVTLRLMGMAFYGFDMSAGSAALVDADAGVDDGTYTANDPGSFICASLFVQGDYHIKAVQESDEGVAQLSETAVNALVAANPSFPLWFKVKHLQNDRYQITLLEITWKLARQYSTDFSYKKR